MRRAKVAVRRAPSRAPADEDGRKSAKRRRGHGPPGEEPATGLRERKKARLRQQIVETALHLFRQRGYENTRIDDIVHTLEISQPTFFRYFPSKDAVLREVGRRAFARQAESLKSELSTKATTEQRLRRFYETLGNTTEVGRPLWQAVILAGAMDPVRSPELRGAEAATVSLLREIIAEGQKTARSLAIFPSCTWRNSWKDCSILWFGSGRSILPGLTNSPSECATRSSFSCAAQSHSPVREIPC